MRAVAIALCCWGTQATAQLDCILQDTICTEDCGAVAVGFAVDAAQFAAPHNPDDPPRRQITNVTLNGSGFVAQAILMEGGVQGFHQIEGELNRLMIVQADGRARMSVQPANLSYVGTCSRS